MDPVETSGTDLVYKGGGDVGDLPCTRVEPGLIVSFWRPTPEELEELNRGGLFRVAVYTEPRVVGGVDVIPLEGAL